MILWVNVKLRYIAHIDTHSKPAAVVGCFLRHGPPDSRVVATRLWSGTPDPQWMELVQNMAREPVIFGWSGFVFGKLWKILEDFFVSQIHSAEASLLGPSEAAHEVRSFMSA